MSTPTAQTSTLGSKDKLGPSSCSGERYKSVPSCVEKSTILRLSFSSRSRFSAFISL